MVKSGPPNRIMEPIDEHNAFAMAEDSKVLKEVVFSM